MIQQGWIVSEAKIITSRRGHPLLLYKKYTYHKRNVNKKGTLWCCPSRISKKCPAQVFETNDGSFRCLQENHNHNHKPPSYHVDVTGKYIRIK